MYGNNEIKLSLLVSATINMVPFFPLLWEIPPAPSGKQFSAAFCISRTGRSLASSPKGWSISCVERQLDDWRKNSQEVESSGCWCYCWYIMPRPYNSLYHKVPTVTTTTVSQQTIRQGYRSTFTPQNRHRLGDVEQGPKGGGNGKYDNASLRFICWICWISQLS